MRQINLDAASLVYAISTPQGMRYIRAHSMQAAKVRAYKVWSASGRAACDTIGQQAPDIGRYGYATACNTVDVMPRKAAHADHAPALRGFYMPTQAKRTRVDNDASRLLALLAG